MACSACGDEGTHACPADVCRPALVADADQLRARVPNGAEAIPVILVALEEQGFHVAAVSTSRPSLDDVYLHYTGRDFSTEDAEGKG